MKYLMGYRLFENQSVKEMYKDVINWKFLQLIDDLAATVIDKEETSIRVGVYVSENEKTAIPLYDSPNGFNEERWVKFPQTYDTVRMLRAKVDIDPDVFIFYKISIEKNGVVDEKKACQLLGEMLNKCAKRYNIVSLDMSGEVDHKQHGWHVVNLHDSAIRRNYISVSIKLK